MQEFLLVLTKEKFQKLLNQLKEKSMQTDSEVFKIIFRDEDKNCVIDTVESNVIPVVGDIVLLSTKEKFEINSRVISFSMKRVIIYGIKI
jgi:hypothetical protein